MPMTENCNPLASIISLDWYALSIKTLHPYREGESFALPQGWQCVEMSATATWMKRWFILDSEGTKLATFLAVPRSPIIDACAAMLEIANPVLYSSVFRDIVDALLLMYPMVVAGVSRADLCADFQMTPARWDVVRGLEQGENYVKGLQRGVTWWSTKEGNRKPHQLSWGGMDSVFHWKLYNKYKELHEEGGGLPSKPYIEQMWKDCGFNPINVWRLEISVTACNRVVDDKGEVIPMFGWWEDRVRLYTRIYDDKFVIRQNQGHADRRRDPRVYLLQQEGDSVKFLRHREPRREIDSDAERRVVCKMWKEYTDPEVRGNRNLSSSIRTFLCDMFAEERNVKAVAKRYGLQMSEVIAMVTEED